MLFSSTKLPGVFLIDIEQKSDNRGFFSRTLCEEELARKGLVSRFVQTSISFNTKAGTLRGMHWQVPPHEETKIVRCTQGRVWDVAVDLRPDSPTYKQWVGVELSAENHRSIYIPAGFAHGFVTLEDDSEMLYSISAFYHPECSNGARWDDGAFGIEWPVKPGVIAEKDLTWKPFCQAV